MIKKNTRIILENNEGNEISELAGGMPLCRGDIVHLHQEDKEGVPYEVVEKTIDCLWGEGEKMLNITYRLRQKQS